MTDINDKKRVGISAQVSVEVTATGEGLALQRVKSPVTLQSSNPDILTKNNQTQVMNKNINQSKCSGNVNPSHTLINKHSTDDDQSKSNQRGNAAQAVLSADQKRKQTPHFCDQERETANVNESVSCDRFQLRKSVLTANDRVTDLRVKQPGKRQKRDRNLVFTSPAILSGAVEELPLAAQMSMRPKANKSIQPVSNWRVRSPVQRTFDGRDRSRSPLNLLRRDDEFEEARRRLGISESRDGDRSPYLNAPPIDSTERSLSDFSSTYKTSLLPTGSNLYNTGFPLLTRKAARKAKRAARRAKARNSIYQIEVQIINNADAFGAISEENQPLLLQVLEKIIQDNGECEYKRKILHVRCLDNETVNCIEKNIPLFNKLMPGADLYLSRKIVIFSPKKVSVFLYNYNLTTEEFFKIIKKQNDYQTDLWRLYHRRDDTQKSVFMIFGVDPRSYERLLNEKGIVYFFFGKISFNLK